MAEPSSAALAAATALTTGTLTLAGSFCGIPADCMLAATLGAAISMSTATRFIFTRASLAAAMGVFVSALVMAVFLGPLLGMLADGLIDKLFDVDLPDGPMRAAGALMTALGGQRWLPALLARVTSAIEGNK